MDPLQLALYRGRLARHAPINKPAPPAPKIPPPNATAAALVAIASMKPDRNFLPGVAPWRSVVKMAPYQQIPPAPRPINMKRIVALVAKEFNVTTEQIRGHYRTQKFVFPRHIAQYLAQRVLCVSLPIVGRYFFRDHTSVLNGIRKIKRKADEDHVVREILERLEATLRGAADGSNV